MGTSLLRREEIYTELRKMLTDEASVKLRMPRQGPWKSSVGLHLQKIRMVNIIFWGNDIPLLSPC